MKQENVLLEKSLLFAARIVKLNKYLVKEKKETIISKLQISLKETAETEYWLRLLILSEYITEKEGESLLNDCLEIKRILVSSLNTAKENK